MDGPMSFPVRRWLAPALLACGLGVLHADGPASGTPPAASGQATTADVRMRAWRAHVDLNEASPFRPLHWEPLGPSLQGGRIEALAAAGPGSSTFYVGPGGGNVWKTTNNGMTWEPVFEHESAFAIGDMRHVGRLMKAEPEETEDSTAGGDQHEPVVKFIDKHRG